MSRAGEPFLGGLRRGLFRRAVLCLTRELPQAREPAMRTGLSWKAFPRLHSVRGRKALPCALNSTGCGDWGVRALAMRFQTGPDSIRPRNVVRIHVDHEDAIGFKSAEDCLDLRPALAKLVLLFRLPFSQDFLGENPGG